MSGDVSKVSFNIQVESLKGVTVPSPTLADDGKVLTYSHASEAYQLQPATQSPVGSSVTMGGDVTGNSAAATVVAIEGKPVPAPGAGDNLKVLQYNNSTGQFQYATFSSGGNSISSTAVGSEPGSPATGDLDFYNNGVYVARYSGAAWVPWGPLFPFTAPVDGDFAWVNQGGASTTTTQGGVFLRGPGSGTGGNSLRIRKKSAPGTPYKITAYLEPTVLAKSNMRYGLLFRESSSSKLVTIDYTLFDTGSQQFRVVQWTNETTVFGAALVTVNVVDLLRWLRIQDNGTNRLYEYSADGQNWITLYTEGRTTFITADEVGWCVSAQGQGAPVLDIGVLLMSWAQS